jgi:molybdopterin molybdotransferase
MALLPVEDALHKVLSGVKPTAAETVKLSTARGRVLARSILAKRDQPPFDASAMDGYAVNSASLGQMPARLKVIGVSAAGHAFKGLVKAGEAVRIFTGAPLPRSTDAVVIQENAEKDGDHVIIKAAVGAGQNVRKRGLDFRKSQTLLEAGRILGARDLGLAASANCPTLPVRQRPRVALFSTGDELVLPGKRPRRDQIMSSNSASLCAFVERFGGIPQDFGIVRDTLPATLKAVRQTAGFDILVTSGGASVGDHDFVQEAFEKSGVKLGFWKIAMRPGKPLVFGTRGRQRILGLPGNPVSAMVCARLFLKPLLDALLGLPPEEPLLQARLGSAMKVNDNRQDYVRARIVKDGTGGLVATPFAVQDSSMQSTLQLADALIVRKPFAEAAQAGDVVDVLLLDF